MDAAVADGDLTALGTLTFDASGHFLLYPTMIGVKVVNTYTNALARVLVCGLFEIYCFVCVVFIIFSSKKI